MSPVAVHNMDDDGLPLSSPLPLSPHVVQASIDNTDAPLSSQSTEETDRTRASHNEPTPAMHPQGP